MARAAAAGGTLPLATATAYATIGANTQLARGDVTAQATNIATHEYARTANPTREALERNVAALEKGKYGIAYSSGMAATDTILRLFGPGDEIVVTDNVYGGTYRLFELVLKQLGYIFKFVDTSDLKQVEAALSPKTKLVFIESPTNPMLRVSDIGAMSPGR